jgi:hypothetical protein
MKVTQFLPIFAKIFLALSHFVQTIRSCEHYMFLRSKRLCLAAQRLRKLAYPPKITKFNFLLNKKKYRCQLSRPILSQF